MKRRSVLAASAAMAAGAAVAGSTTQAAYASPINDTLAKKLTGDPKALHAVVVTYKHSGPPTTIQVELLQRLGITTGITMQALPIAGILATAAQVQELAQSPDVLSIVANSELTYTNYESREISGAKRATDNQADFNRAVPFSGKGVTVMVNDSGIDATHQDLKFREHVVENVQAAQNIVPGVGNDIIGQGIVPITYIEGVPNTDLGSGHGTHCAGTVGGTGQASQGRYRGVAPGADLVGYGSGAVLLILDAVGGFDYALIKQFSFRSPIRVISNSWGSSGKFDPTNPVNVASYECYKRGILSVFSAGNSGPGEDTHNPYSQAPWVISVGAGRKNGELVDFSSRGKRGESGQFTMSDGTEWRYYNEPTVVATGVDVISTRDPLGALTPLAAQQDAAAMAPAHLPFYTHMSGTSMSCPNVSGMAALMFEANPNLTPAEVRHLFNKTATNMTARANWEVGAGHINVYAALVQATGRRSGHGRTLALWQSWNSRAVINPGPTQPFEFTFAPVGETGSQTFDVGNDVAWVSATATIGDNTLALVLIDPNGNRYGSSISTPALGDTVTTGGPGVPGKWTVTARGIGAVSGQPLDPAKVTNGYGAPGQVSGELGFLLSGGYTGLDDIANHPHRSAIEYAISNRLMDGYPGGQFRPDQELTRGELANYLVLGQSVRQHLPLGGGSSFNDVGSDDFVYPYAEAVAAKGGALRDRSISQDPVMIVNDRRFNANELVTRASLMYSFVQCLALQEPARAFNAELTAFYDGRRIPVKDAHTLGSVPAGYAQVALDQGVINARFVAVQGPTDPQPTIEAYVDGDRTVTRGAYAVYTGRWVEAWKQPE